MDIVERFIGYTKIDTTSSETTNTVPSSKNQLILAKILKDQLLQLNMKNVEIDKNGFVYATLEQNCDQPAMTVGFLAHMDTSNAASGKNIKARVIENYDGNDICLSKGQYCKLEDYPFLKELKGDDIIVTDGKTLLGADDKAGIAIIMDMLQYFSVHPEIKHGRVEVCFTIDEEIGEGSDGFDLDRFSADYGYTVDGGAWGEIEYENFNAASGKVIVHGQNVHPGSAKGIMKNAILIAQEFQQMLPTAQNPMYTEGYEGFFHLDSIRGNVEETVCDYIIRDFDEVLFARKKALFEEVAAFLNQKYGDGTVEAIVQDSYYNMMEKIKPHMHLIDRAKEAMQQLGKEAKVVPIRGGTDGARLSFMGLPCPNLCAGGENFHSRFEYISIESMEKITKMLIILAKMF